MNVRVLLFALYNQAAFHIAGLVAITLLVVLPVLGFGFFPYPLVIIPLAFTNTINMEFEQLFIGMGYNRWANYFNFLRYSLWQVIIMAGWTVGLIQIPALKDLILFIKSSRRGITGTYTAKTCQY